MLQNEFLQTTNSADLNIEINDVNLGTLKKAFNYARTRLKVRLSHSIRTLNELFVGAINVATATMRPPESSRSCGYRNNLMLTN